ncbi:hypothetical protein A7A08_01424 [Methyloligella halotolerans]|uniref:Uncharacterized protein n=1 Tax=Methyloligella halotolerans TaxID=1177755 RepID=A0A1E2RZ16_9HYPH|nr:hypothetical protein [Methyloligella halotolerans]ODA67392.1 hypothetical protein A7A08_01424 [Methyloligella halotolerans]
MSKFVKAMVWVAVVFLGLLALYKIVYPTVTYRYRMTVEVEVDGKVHSGSSVIEVKVIKHPRIIPSLAGSRDEITGQAVYVDLGDGRNVFALLGSAPYATDYHDYPAYIVLAHFDLSYTRQDLRKFPYLTGEWTIDPLDPPAIGAPAFMTFGDLDNPGTATLVDPKDFSRAFGPTVGPPIVKIEMTDKPVTTDLFKTLPWLKELVLPAWARDASDPNGYLEAGKHLGTLKLSQGIK